MATPLDAAQVLVMPGRVQVKTIHDLFEHTHSGATGMQVQYARPLVGEAVPPEAIGKTREGDLVAHFTNVDAGELTACVIGINGDLNDPAQWRKLQAHQNDLEIKCAIASASDRSVVIEAPPQKRLD
jgi:hypothetical protein